MLTSPYHTRYGSAIQHKHIKRILLQELIQQSSYLIPIAVEDGLPRTYSLSGTVRETEDIPLFTQCIDIQHHGNTILVSDDRQAGTSPRELLLNKLNVILTSLWMNNNQRLIKQSTTLAGRVFTNVLTNAVIQKFGLSLQDTGRIRLACGLYYNDMFLEDDGEDRYKTVGNIKLYTGSSSTEVETYLDTRGSRIPDIPALAVEIRGDNNPALRKFNEVSIYTLMTNIYYGLNSKEHVSVALEYPPRWVALVALVMQDAGFNRTILGSTTKKLLDRDDSMVDFIKYMLKE